MTFKYTLYLYNISIYIYDSLRNMIHDETCVWECYLRFIT